jgi:hypothetical protein
MSARNWPAVAAESIQQRSGPPGECLREGKEEGGPRDSTGGLGAALPAHRRQGLMDSQAPVDVASIASAATVLLPADHGPHQAADLI